MNKEEKYKKAINELADSYELHLKQWAKRCIDTINEYTTNLQQENKKQKEVINKAIEYLTSYSSIHTIQFGTENDSLNDIELNKTLDEKTLNEMTYRYLLVHDKLLEILEVKEVSK